MRRLFLSAAAFLAATPLAAAQSLPAAPARGDEPISTPRRLIPNFDILNIVPVLDELGVSHSLRESDDGRPFLAASIGDTFTFNVAPTACLSSDYSRCIGVNFVAIFAVSDPNPQTISAFNQKNEFTSVGLYGRDGLVFLLRYEIADYGIPRGNFASSLAQFLTAASRLETELSSGPKTVSQQGFASDLAAGALNRGSLVRLGGGAAPRHPHDDGLEEAAAMAEILIRSGAPVNPVGNHPAK